MKEEPTCCNCKSHVVCIIWNTMFSKLPINTNLITYPDKFKNLYETVADICTSYQGYNTEA